MIRNIVHSEEILKIKSIDATIDDIGIVDDMIDTFNLHRERCVGMAANMIGFHKNIILFLDDKGEINIMINPKIIKKIKPYKIYEECLSLDGERETTRYKKIQISYYDINFTKKIRTYEGFTAEVIQHEIDHLMGIII